MNRRTVGIITAELSDSYQEAIWNGIVEEAERGGERVICFLGSRINSPEAQETAANTVYELATSRNISGLIVVASAISTYAGGERVQRLFDAYGSIPKVSIGVPVSDASCIVADGREALYELIDHLVNVHGRSRFAMIAGPQWHFESEQRKKAIQERLDYHHIDLPQHSLVYGTYEPESGKQAIRVLLDNPQPPDAVLCLNDRMALGVLEELRDLGIKVPGDMSVVGFDDIEDGQYSTPPLTTVHQPLRTLGEASMRQIREMMNNSGVRTITHSCRAVFRESCGCRTFLAHQSPRPSLTETAIWTTEQIAGFAQSLHAELTAKVTQGKALPSWSDNFAEEDELNRPADDPSAYQAVYHRILGELRERKQGSRRLADRARTAALRAIGLSLSEAFETPVLLSRLRNGLKTIGFSEAYLVLYEDKTNSKNRSRILLAGSVENGYDTASDLFSGDLILPEGFFRDDRQRDAWTLVPLVFTNQALGYLILPGGIPDGEVYEVLAMQLASSLRGAMLLEQVRSHEQSLEREVSRRTEQLVATNKALEEEIAVRTRLEAEVVEISRRTMERIGQNLHDDLCQYLAGISMHLNILEKNLKNEASSLRPLASQANHLIHESIDRTKAIARGLLPAGLHEQGLAVALEALVDASRRSSGIPIEIKGRPSIEKLETDLALDIYGIVQEALNNSLRHSRCRNIEIRLLERESEGSEKELITEVVDDGCGFDGATDAKGMGLKIMKYRAEKAGGKLSISHGNPGSIIRCVIPLPKAGR